MAEIRGQYDIDDVHLVGYEGLAIAIVKSAVHDLIKYKDNKQHLLYIKAKDFLLSEWCTTISGLETKVLRDNIKRYYEVDIYENN